MNKLLSGIALDDACTTPRLVAAVCVYSLLLPATGFQTSKAIAGRRNLPCAQAGLTGSALRRRSGHGDTSPAPFVAPAFKMRREIGMAFHADRKYCSLLDHRIDSSNLLRNLLSAVSGSSYSIGRRISIRATLAYRELSKIPEKVCLATRLTLGAPHTNRAPCLSRRPDRDLQADYTPRCSASRRCPRVIIRTESSMQPEGVIKSRAPRCDRPDSGWAPDASSSCVEIPPSQRAATRAYNVLRGRKRVWARLHVVGGSHYARRLSSITSFVLVSVLRQALPTIQSHHAGRNLCT